MTRIIRQGFLRFVALTCLIFSFSMIPEQACPQILWEFDLGDMSFGQSATADIDEDGKPEIVFSTYMNDGKIYALNAEDGSLLWVYDVGSCCDAAPLIADVDGDGHLEVILGSSCIPKTYCFDGITGGVKWQVPTGGTDSPPTIGDVDKDGKPEILHGQFNGSVLCLNGEDGSIAWELLVDANASIQTCPTLLDVDGNGQLDVVVATWSFSGNNKICAYRGDDQSLIWESHVPQDYIYHGASFGDVDQDGKPELAIGSYDHFVYLLDAEDGNLKWSFDMGPYCYVGGPTQLADLDNDGLFEILANGWYKVKAIDTAGNQRWTYNFPNYGSSFRGAAISDIDHDGILDAVYGNSEGMVIGLRGSDGHEIFSLDLAAAYGDTFDIDHAPVIGDFDGDGLLDGFIAGGKTYYPNISLDYGRAYAFRLGAGTGPDWPMFQRDSVRSSCVPLDWINSVPILPGNKGLQMTVYPNPFSDEVRINFSVTHPETLTIGLYDMQGRPVMAEKSVISLNDTVILLKPAETLTAGVYFLKVSGCDTVISQRIIKFR